MKIEKGFNGKPLEIRINGADRRVAEVWIEQLCPKRTSEDGREETLAYATIDELLDLQDEIKSVIQKLTK